MNAEPGTVQSPPLGHGRQPWRRRFWLGLPLVLLSGSGCELRQAMYDQERFEPFEAAPTSLMADGMSARKPVPGTVPRGGLRLDEHFFQGKVEGELATALPVPVAAALLARGRERYDIFCSPCHDRAGGGNGVVVQRGFKAPPSFHLDRLRQAPVGHFFDVATNGFGVMYSYASRIPVADRWAITAYVRALQFSQNAPLDHLPEEDRKQLPDKPREPLRGDSDDQRAD